MACDGCSRRDSRTRTIRKVARGRQTKINLCGGIRHASWSALKALIELEQQTREAGGLVLRVGHLYGPGTAFAPDGYFVHQIKARRVPLIRESSATFSFIHVEDARNRDAGGLGSGRDRGPQRGR